MEKRPAVFFDRDGTLIEERHFLNRIEQISVLPGAVAAVRRVNEAGFLVVLATNQSAVARGLLTEEGLQRIHRELEARFEEGDAKFDGFFHCPHHPDFAVSRDGACPCRKPAPGLLFEAAAELNIDLPRSFSIGDRLRDVEAGHRAGCQAILVTTGYGAQEVETLADTPWDSPARPDHVAKDVAEAVSWILERHD